MKLSCDQVMNENGAVLIIALIILVLLTLVGISVTRTTEIEIQIAGNQQFQKIAFYTADSGIYSTPKLIRKSVNESAQPTVSAITYLDASSDTFYREIMGYDTYDTTSDISYNLGGHVVEVDVERTGQESLVGGGVEFGSGAEGIGTGSAGGVAIFYTMASEGEGPASAQAEIEGVYRLLPGIAGGM